LECSRFSQQSDRENRKHNQNPSGIQIAARRDFSEDSMKKVFLLIVVLPLLVAMGFAQTPPASGNTDQINIKGCLGGSDGNYTVAEDNTGKIFKITTSGADLKAYVGQDLNLIGHKAGTAESDLAVTDFNMISEHCAASAGAPAATASTTPDTISTPAAAPATAAAAAVSTTPDTISTPPPAAAVVPAAGAPAATVSTTPDTISTPAAAAAAPAEATPAGATPAATVSKPVETSSAPAAADAVHRTRPSARPLKPATPAAAPAGPVDTHVADGVVPTEPVSPPQETATAPAVPASKPMTSRSAWMIASIVVVVLLIGAAPPLYNRWRKQKLLEQTRGQNLSFTHNASSDPGKSDTAGGRKAA
jgi:hypothetical protein